MKIFDFLRKKSRSVGSVLFRGSLPPRLENFEFLEKWGIALEPRRADADFVWAARARHPQWGQADLYCPRQILSPPPEFVKLDPWLTPAEMEAVTGCASSVEVVMQHEQENVLRERKSALRMMRAVMGDDGVCVFDDGSQRFWSRPALEEELAHDAALDIESLFILHAVRPDGDDDAPVYWLHSHGLAELGYFDFDILEPSSDVVFGAASGLTRAIAFGIVEGWIQADSPHIQIAQPDGVVRLVPADVFQRRAPARFTALRDDASDGHSAKRSVLCNPAPRFFAKLFGDKIEPSRWLREPIAENSIIHFSATATNLMAQRARGSYSLFRCYAEEFAELQVKAMFKLGLQIDGGEAGAREHLWFEATRLDESTITGTLLNAPWHIASLAQGQTYTHDLEVLSDWCLRTPAGSITPVEGMAARTLRANRDEILQTIRASESGR